MHEIHRNTEILSKFIRIKWKINLLKFRMRENLKLFEYFSVENIRWNIQNGLKIKCMWWIYTIRKKSILCQPYIEDSTRTQTHTHSMWYFYSESFGFCAVFSIILRTNRTDRRKHLEMRRRYSIVCVLCVFVCVCRLERE